MTATAWFGTAGGGLLAALGTLGLAVTGLADPFAPVGKHLLVLSVNPAQNLLHLVLGVGMVIGAAGTPTSARTTVLVASAALGTLGLLGPLLAGPAGNPLALGPWTTLLHLGLAGGGAAATLREAGDHAPTDTTAPRHP